MVIDMGYTGVRWCLIFHITFLKLELWNGSLGLNQPFLEFQAWSPCLLISTLLYCLPLHSIKVIALGHPIVVGRLLPWVYELQQPWHDHSLNQTAHQYQSTKCMLKAMTMNKGGTVLKQVPIEIPRGEIMELSRDHSRLWPSVSLAGTLLRWGVSQGWRLECQGSPADKGQGGRRVSNLPKMEEDCKHKTDFRPPPLNTLQ